MAAQPSIEDEITVYRGCAKEAFPGEAQPSIEDATRAAAQPSIEDEITVDRGCSARGTRLSKARKHAVLPKTRAVLPLVTTLAPQPSIEDAARTASQPSIEDEITVYRGCAKGLSTANRLSRMKLPSIEDAANRLSRMLRTVYRGCECPAEQATTGVRPGLTRARGLTRLSLNGLTRRKATDAASWGLRPRRLGPSAPQPTRRPPGLRPRPSASPCYRAPTPRRGGITPLRGLCAPSSRGLPPHRPPCGRLCRPPVANSPPRGPSSPPA